MEVTNEKEYRWETGYEKTWEDIIEDPEGCLSSETRNNIILKARRSRMKAKADNRNKLGIIRHMYLVVDASLNMSQQDLKPTRMLCTAKILETFFRKFYYLNPLSQLGLIVTYNKRAEILAQLAGGAVDNKKIDEIISQLKSVAGGGEPSLQNSLELALQSLQQIPPHSSREVLIVMGSLTTCDPGDIDSTIEKCRKNSIRCSLISLSAEVWIGRQLCSATKGDFGVILDDCHYRDLLFSHLDPPVSSEASEASLIKMGFPRPQTNCENDSTSDGSPSALGGMCLCHLEGQNGEISLGGFVCPQCQAKFCELPIDCKCCGLTLVSAPHLARSYRHLFPLKAFLEKIPSASDLESGCISCARGFTSDRDTRVYSCPMCDNLVCSDCDVFVHEVLYTCPGCASGRKLPSNEISATS